MITVKNVKIIQSMSEETLCFTATIYENGIKIGEASNRGYGGNTDIHLDDPRSKTQSEYSALEEKVDELVYEIDKQKQMEKTQKKLDRDCIKNICVGWINEFGASYYAQGFKGSPTLAEVALKPNGLVAIQRMYDRIKSELKGDDKILNTNLKALGITV